MTTLTDRLLELGTLYADYASAKTFDGKIEQYDKFVGRLFDIWPDIYREITRLTEDLSGMRVLADTAIKKLEDADALADPPIKAPT